MSLVAAALQQDYIGDIHVAAFDTSMRHRVCTTPSRNPEQEVEMVRSVKHLERFTIVATDGAIGAVDDIFFDDERWAVRYVVVDTGKWLPGHRVLVSPLSITHVEWGEQRMRVSITRDQVAHSPDVDTHKPVSRQYEMSYFDY